MTKFNEKYNHDLEDKTKVKHAIEVLHDLRFLFLDHIADADEDQIQGYRDELKQVEDVLTTLDECVYDAIDETLVKKGVKLMKQHYIFYTAEGQTLDDNSQYIENCQVLDFQVAESMDKAVEQFMQETAPGLEDYSFDEVKVFETRGMNPHTFNLKEEN